MQRLESDKTNIYVTAKIVLPKLVVAWYSAYLYFFVQDTQFIRSGRFSLLVYIKFISNIPQWALKSQIDINIWSISWPNINIPDFDIWLMSNSKYHMDINTWGQYDVKSVSRKWPLPKILVKTNLVWKHSLADSKNITVPHKFDVNGWHNFNVNWTFFAHWRCRYKILNGCYLVITYFPLSIALGP